MSQPLGITLVRGRFAAACAMAGALVACGSSACTSPTAPGGLTLRSGTYRLQFSGGEDACPGMAAAGNISVTTSIEVSFVSHTWRALPVSNAGGAFELQFSPGPVGPGAPGGGPGVIVTPTGTVISTVALPLGSVPDGRLVFGDGVKLTGGLSIDGRVGGGTISGAVTFANSSGVSVSCHSSTGTMFWSISWSG